MESLRLPDPLDMQIINLLRATPAITNKKIAAQTGVAEATVANRIRAMADDHIMRLTAQRDLFAMGLRVMAFVFFSVGDRPKPEVAADLAQFDEVISVSQTLGRAQLFSTVVGENRKQIQEFISTKVGTIKGIQHITCDICLDILKFESGYGDLRTPPPSIEGATPSAEKDEFIIRQLQTDGRISNREIARKLGVSETSIRQRLKRLTSNGAIKISAICDPFRLGLSVIGLVRINISPAHMQAAAEKLSNNPHILLVGITTGSYNFMCLIPGQNAGDLANFINNNISTLEGAGEIDIVSITEVFKQRYDLIRILD